MTPNRAVRHGTQSTYGTELDDNDDEQRCRRTVESKRSLRRPRRSTLIQDSLTIDRLRSYPNPLAQRHLANEIDSETVQTMMAVTEEHYGFAQDYFGDNMRRKAPSERPYFILKLGGTTSSMLFPDQCHLGTLSQTCSPLT